MLALLVLLGAGAATHAQTAWISDVLTVPVRSGPSNGHRIIHRGIPSGTRFEILDRDADSGYVQVRTSGGTEGWILEQYAVTEPIARDRLGAATREVERLNSTVQELRTRLETVQQDKDSAEQASATQESQVSELQIELADLKRVSASALEIDANNTRLTELNARLRDELDMLGTELDQLRDNTQQRWLMIGGGLVLLGLLLGLSVKSRPRRSAWS
jgi:SH3 domain protein